MTTRTENDREKAVAIAKDVLEQLEAKKVIPGESVYLGHEFVKFCRENPEELQGKLDDAGPCEACALGSLLLSRCRLYNDLRGDTVSVAWAQEGSLCDMTYRQLLDVFTTTQLHCIEAAYEGYGIGPAYRFHCQYVEAEEVLQQICLNIIHNDGHFDPENHPEE